MSNPNAPSVPPSPSPGAWRRAALVAALLALTPFVLHELQPYTFLFEDGTFYANVNRSLAERGTFRQDAYAPRSWYFDDLGWNRELGQDWSNVALGADETTLYPKHPVLLPLLAHPFFLAFGLDGLLLFNLLGLAACVVTLARLVDPGRRRPLAVAAVLATFASPVVLHWALAYSNDVFAGALVAGAVLAVRTDRALAAGLLAGGALWARPVHVLALAAGCGPDVWRWARADRRRLARWAGGAALVLCAWASLNAAWFGSPFVTGYDRVVVRHGGLTMLESASAAFDVPLSRGLPAALFESSLGFVPGFPMLALAPLGWLALARRREWIPLTASAIALGGACLVYGAYRWPSARFLFPFLLFVIEPLSALLEEVAAFAGRSSDWLRARIRAGWPRAALGVATALVAAALLRGTLGLMHHPEGGPATGARVTAEADTIPCDFWNLKWQRWECSHLDRDERDQVGAPAEGECPTEERGWVRLPAAGPWRDKAVHVPRGPGANALRWWAMPARGFEVPAEARLSVEGRDRGQPDGPFDAAGGPNLFALAADAPGVTFRVATGGRSGPPGAALCLRWEWLAREAAAGPAASR